MDIIYNNIYNDVSCWKHIVPMAFVEKQTQLCIMASIYLLGIHVYKDEAKAIEILGVNQNCSDCINLLGHCYDEGKGVKKDFSKP